ncbi:MAG: VWA domain-containing protein [Acidobacteriia bacterium]|nr:VWA domain-containing protein [Terriglobia bacterium]
MFRPPESRVSSGWLILATFAIAFALPCPRTESRPQTVNPPPQNAETQAAAAQEASLKVEAPSVIADVIVTDKKGQHASGLAAEDFRVYEDEAPQKIVTFVPPVIEAAPPTAEPPPAGPTVKRGLDLTRVRFITLVMDLGDLQPASVKRATDAAIQYLEKNVAPEDYVAIYWIDESLHVAVPFTRDKQQAAAGLRKLGGHVPGGRFSVQARQETQREIDDLLTSIYGIQAAATLIDPTLAAGGHSSGASSRLLGTLRAFLWTQSTIQARAVFVALRAIAQSYADIPGRKNVVVFSEGFLHSPDVKAQMAAVIDAANRSNVAFYVIDAAGLQAGYGALSSSVEQTVNQEFYQMAMEGPGDNYGGYNKFDWAQRLGTNIQYDDLGQVASATGGFLMKNQNDLLDGLGRIDSDLREFYTLVYQPTNKTYDGSFRKIRVELLKPGYHVRHRLGYWAIPPGQETIMTPAAAQLLAGLATGTLKPAFAPQVNAAVLLAPNGQLAAPVCVSIPPSSVKFEKDPKQDLYRAGLTLVLVGRESTGRLLTVHQRFLNLQFDKKQLAEFERKGSLDINARLVIPKLEPINLEVILQFSHGAVALGRQTVAVEAAKPSGPHLTSILLSNRIEAGTGPADPSDPLRGPNYQLYMPAQPRFPASDKLTVYFGLLDVPVSPTTHRPELRLSFAVKSGAKAVMTLPSEQIVALPKASENRLLVLKQFDLRELRPGPYTFEVTVEDQVTGGVVSQMAKFLVE